MNESTSFGGKNAYVHGQTLGLVLCQALKLDPNTVKGIWIDATVDDLARIQVEFVIPCKDGGFAELLNDYLLVHNEDCYDE